VQRRVAILSAAVCWVVAGLLVAACDSAPSDQANEAVRDQLVGTWLRAYEENGTLVRRILVLNADGKFREMVSIVEPGATVLRKSHAGDWLFDGTNLKRRYSSINGEPVRAPAAPLATFEVTFPTRSEFIGTDHVHKRDVRYQRVDDGTQP
jgi:hypothetical protein